MVDSTEGYIKEASGEVLGVLDGKIDTGNEVLLGPVNDSMKDAQTWVRDKEASNGWFTLRNKASGKLFTAKNNTILTIEGNFDDSEIFFPILFPRLQPYLFAHPNLISSIISRTNSWTISWQIIPYKIEELIVQLIIELIGFG